MHMFHNQNRVGQTLQKKEILRRVGAEVGGKQEKI